MLTVLDDELKSVIQEGYRNFLRSRKLRPRAGQRQMIGAIATHLTGETDSPEGAAPPLCVVEAGTGTGKTIGYLLPTLPVARALGKKVVVATATVSLQGQLVDKDIPELLAATGWNQHFALAKGRGRYLCNLKLENCLEVAGANKAGRHLFEDEIPFVPEAGATELFAELSACLDDGTWSGDRDTWPAAIGEALWRALTITPSQCAGRRCRLIRECCFYRARAQLESVDCIVANHDLVMADLALGGGAILPPPAETIYVFDEAHRLADTTLRHFASSCSLQGSIDWLEQMHRGLAQAAKVVAGDGVLIAAIEALDNARSEAQRQTRELTPLLQAVLETSLTPGSSHYRFPRGDIGEGLRTLAEGLARSYTAVVNHLDDILSVIEQQIDRPGSIPREEVEPLFQGLGGWQGRMTPLARLWVGMARKDGDHHAPWARWVAEGESSRDLVLWASPITAAEQLRENLWQRCFAAVATSATLQALGSFDRFATLAGLSEQAHKLAVPGVFDFTRAGVLAIPDIGADGGDARAHTLALSAHLGDFIDLQEGTLVLFSSRRQMEDVAEGVDSQLRDQLLVQGEYSHGEILRRHRERIDSGKGNVIFGLASFAEGLDLPGDYCRHVVIAKLPFAVPDDPLQAAQAEWLESQGLNSFRSMTLPDASLKLIQACGRLLRSERDSGRVTILDRRLISKGYGRQLLDALPPFRREISR